MVKHDSGDQNNWLSEAAKTRHEQKIKSGIECGDVEVLIHVRPLEGLVRQVDGTVEKRFSKKEVLYPMQVKHQIQLQRMSHSSPTRKG